MMSLYNYVSSLLPPGYVFLCIDLICVAPVYISIFAVSLYLSLSLSLSHCDWTDRPLRVSESCSKVLWSVLRSSFYDLYCPSSFPTPQAPIGVSGPNHTRVGVGCRMYLWVCMLQVWVSRWVCSFR